MQINKLNKLIASDATAYDYSGRSVAISGNTVVVGAYGDACTAGDYCGAAIIYEFNDTSGDFEQSAILTASDRADDDEFGYSVAISGNTVVVGAFLDDDAGADSSSSLRPLCARAAPARSRIPGNSIRISPGWRR